MTKEVIEYLERQKSPQKEIVQSLRKIILESLPGIREKLWMGVPWYENFYIVALKDHVNLGFCIDGLTTQERALFEGKGRTMRHIKFYTLNDVDTIRVTMLLKLVAERQILLASKTKNK